MVDYLSRYVYIWIWVFYAIIILCMKVTQYKVRPWLKRRRHEREVTEALKEFDD